MLSMFQMLAQMGIGDTPDAILILFLAVWPFHIYCALSGSVSVQLVGYGPAAIRIQAIGLALFVVAAMLILRSKKRVGFKLLAIPIMYGVVVLGTNLLPSLF